VSECGRTKGSRRCNIFKKKKRNGKFGEVQTATENTKLKQFRLGGREGDLTARKRAGGNFECSERPGHAQGIRAAREPGPKKSRKMGTDKYIKGR